MTINYKDKVIELNCSSVDISEGEHGIQMIFNGENELDYFLVQRHFDDEDFISVFYTEGCNTEGHWTFIQASLDKYTITFSVDKMPIRIDLKGIPVNRMDQMRETLRTMIGLMGKLTENDSQYKAW